MENCCEGDDGGVAKQPPEHRPERLPNAADELATVTQSPQRRDARAAPQTRRAGRRQRSCATCETSKKESRRRRLATRLLKGGNDFGTIQAGERVDVIAVGDDDSLRADSQIRRIRRVSRDGRVLGKTSREIIFRPKRDRSVA